MLRTYVRPRILSRAAAPSLLASAKALEALTHLGVEPVTHATARPLLLVIGMAQGLELAEKEP
jgi:hypothetical protein